MAHIPFRSTARPCLRASGFSLVELMVALTLGLIILAALLDAFNSNSATGTTNTRYAEVQTNGRYAIDFLRRELHHSGYLGVQGVGSSATSIESSNIIKSGATGTANYGTCGTGTGAGAPNSGESFVTAIEWQIWGSNNANGTSCGMTVAANTDVLVLRRVNGMTKLICNATPAPTYGANTLYVRSELNEAIVFLGSAPPTCAVRPGETYTPEDYPLEVDVYYISPYTTASTDNPQVPALYRLSLGTDATVAMARQLIATGIENMQVQYGVQVSGGGINYVDASSVASTDWPNVVSAKVWLLARSTDLEYGGFVNNTAYVMGDRTVNGGGDHYVRQLFTVVVQLRN